MPLFVLYSILKAVLMTKAAKPKQETVTSGVDPSRHHRFFLLVIPSPPPGDNCFLLSSFIFLYLNSIGVAFVLYLVGYCILPDQRILSARHARPNQQKVIIASPPFLARGLSRLCGSN